MDQYKEEEERNHEWVENITDLVESYRKLITLHIVSNLSLGISVSTVALISILLGLFVILFAGLGLAWWLGEYLNNMKAGFFLVGSGYSVFFILLLVTARKWVAPWIRDSIIKKLYE